MSGQDILGQDEIDALMNGGVLPSAPVDVPPAKDEARNFDFGNNVRIVRGRMPTLEMINERFGRLLRPTVYNLLRQSATVSVGPVEILKFGEYIRRLHLPTSLNLVRMNPLRGTGLVILDPKLVFALVDTFFGGRGRHAKIEGREFTAIETRVIGTLLENAFRDFREAWSHVVELTVEKIGSEVNPQFANIVSPSEIVVVNRFSIDIEGVGGDLHVTMPYSMIEPLREVLVSGMQSDRVEQDDRWSQTLRHEVGDAEVELRAHLGQSTLTVEDLLKLRAGDVLTTDFAGELILYAEDVPMFKGAFGLSGGRQALKINDLIRRPGEDATR